MDLFDLNNQYKVVRKDFLMRIDSIMKKSEFILGQEVKLFEQEFAQFCKVKFAVGVNSGTDALFLSLKALGIGSGDEVIVPSFTFIATSFAVTYTGAKPVFVDIDEYTYNIDPNKVEKAVTKRTKAIIPVHLFGLCANMPEILKIAKKNNLAVIEDACQAHGSKINDRFAGSIGDFGCFSFYPTKNLSAFGDAGLITTNSNKYYMRLLQLRDCGRGKIRYEHKLIGYNSRLDNSQALFLRLKLEHLREWNQKRIKIARLYTNYLKEINDLIIPFTPQGYKHVFHVFAIRTRKRNKTPNGYNKRKSITRRWYGNTRYKFRRNYY